MLKGKLRDEAISQLAWHHATTQYQSGSPGIPTCAARWITLLAWCLIGLVITLAQGDG